MSKNGFTGLVIKDKRLRDFRRYLFAVTGCVVQVKAFLLQVCL